MEKHYYWIYLYNKHILENMNGIYKEITDGLIQEKINKIDK
jgi:hypothetical protein